ncbi:conjugal pilus assembly protein TraF [Candidatus Rubidus massiliensis]|nr:conjugal pilus assembly protein TraF [Candidatus Rubidus massiliensis]
MKYSMKFFLLLFLTFYSEQLSAGWLNRKAEGWSWYEDKVKKQNNYHEESDKLSPVAQMEIERKTYETKLSQAVLDPTEENIESLMIEQKKIMDRSSKFSKIWTKILLSNPELDSTINNPITQYGVTIAKDIERDKKNKLIGLLKEEFGLILFTKGNKESQAFALVVKEFVKKHKWELIPVSVDGEIIPAFPNAQLDQGIVDKLGISIYPSLIMLNPKTEELIPIGFGMISLEQIENNIVNLFGEVDE